MRKSFMLNAQKILVVGGNGYVGNFISAALVRNAATVSTLSRYLPTWSRSAKVKYHYEENAEIDWLQGDASNPSAAIQ